ncbi:guanyl-specific ribonuclease Sa [Kitasatospora sp. MAP12-15]|uniref:hypothetical protein n=1 Tax=unclassified Kitasatospora TaxID=2633591 RepID=UPI00247513AB|nr:hypothetical protein [Kitasatospora sp. MAP12-44]MDH6112061.1 guanyl-specific ribonuclease Sa [Kitasatospora sp. MAP12-44]
MTKPRSPWGSGNDDSTSSDSPVELLLRAALESRADEITVHDLRPAVPPAQSTRRTRRLYAVTLPVIGLAAAVAVGFLALGDTVKTAQREVQPAVTGAFSPTPGMTDVPSTTSSASASTPASASASARSSATVSASATTTGAPSSSAVSGANAVSGQYLASTWLTAAELPLSSTFHWQAANGMPTNTTGEFQWLWVCGSGSPVAELQTTSISTLAFTAAATDTGSVASSAPAPQASQTIFYFKSAHEATTALDRIRQDYTGCAADKAKNGPGDITTGMKPTWQITRTATSAAGFAYRSMARTAGGEPVSMLDLPSDAQESFVLSGNVITMVSISGSDAAVDPDGGAAQTLTTMATRLSTFPK